ncbi:MAG: LPS export ABC transporter permease LptF [Janthinobacterium lividum]
MIFQRSLQRELAYTAASVFLVLLTIMLTTMMIRIVGFAASGKIDPRDVLVLIGLTVIGYLGVMLIATLFVSILFVLTRWYRDSEMVVWFASGVGLKDLIRPVFVFAAPIIVLIALASFFAWPWSNAQRALLTERFNQRDDVSLIAPGQFRESTTHRVIFIEKLLATAQKVENVFVAGTENGKISVVVAHNGEVESAPNGDRFVVLENGRRYDGEPGKPDFRVMEFRRYGVKIENHQVVSRPTPSGMSSASLLQLGGPTSQGELAWRASVPLMAIVLTLLAIPLAYQSPRRSRTVNLVMAVLVYLTYSNLLNLLQSWIEQGRVSVAVGLPLLHLVALAIVSVLFWSRARNRPLFSRRPAAAPRAPQ